MIAGLFVASAALPVPAAILQKQAGSVVYSLRWKPKIGEVHRYQVKVKFDYGEASLEFGSELKIKVVSVSDDGGYAVQSVTTGATVTSGTEVRSLPAQEPVEQFYSKAGLPVGKSVDSRDADPFADLLDHLTDFQSPSGAVKLRESWVNRPLAANRGLFGQPRLSYMLVDLFREGSRHLAKIRYTASIGGDPEAAEGTLLIDRENNHLYGVDAAIPHFHPEGAHDEAMVTISLKEKSEGVK